MWNEHKRWPMYSKFFDNKGPLPASHPPPRRSTPGSWARRASPRPTTSRAQLNNHGGDFPYTFFGLRARHHARTRCATAWQNFAKGDNQITDLSTAYRLEPGTGWDVPAGILHAPGSLCTYEPQWASDVFAMYQSLTGDARSFRRSCSGRTRPKERVGDLDYLLEVLDWDANVDPDFAAAPLHGAEAGQAGRGDGRRRDTRRTGSAYVDRIQRQGTDRAARAGPSPSMTPAAYGLIMLQGHGTLGVWDIETPALIRFGQLTHDEFFVTEAAAKAGVTINNPSKTDPIVMLKHFGPGNPDLKL